MAGIKLETHDYGRVKVADGIHPSVDLPVWRLRVWVRLGGEPIHRQAIIDTGAPLTWISKRLWEKLDAEGRIEWVSHPTGLQDDPERVPRMTAVGGASPYRLGRVMVEMVELGSQASLPPVSVLAQFLEDLLLNDHAQLIIRNRLILGLGQSAFANRELRVAFGPNGNPTIATVTPLDELAS